jgi:hypothetical protein
MVTATAVVAIALVAISEGPRLLGSDEGPGPAPAASSSGLPSASPSPATQKSLVAQKCAEKPFLWHGKQRVTFSPNREGTLEVQVGSRVLLGGISDFCQQSVQFQGGRRLLSPKGHIGSGADWLIARAPGTVSVSATKPMCAMSDDPQCLGGIAQLGTIKVEITPKVPLAPVTRTCSADDIRLRAEYGPGTASTMVWVTARLIGSTPCRFNSKVDLQVTDRHGGTVTMPDNPATKFVSRNLRGSLVVTWFWEDWFCGTGFPYAATFTALGGQSTAHGVTPPGCPTDFGRQPKEPDGLSFSGIRVFGHT